MRNFKSFFAVILIGFLVTVFAYSLLTILAAGYVPINVFEWDTVARGCFIVWICMILAMAMREGNYVRK